MKAEINKEQAILEAAEKEFLEKGFAMSKTIEIAKAAGVTHAMLHYYFRTKENLFEKVFQEKAKLIADSFFTITDNDLPFLEKISQAIRMHFDFLANNPKLVPFIINEIVTNDNRKETCRRQFLPIVQKVQARLKKEIEKEVANGTIRFISSIDLIFSIVSLNASVFLARPIVDMITNGKEESYKTFLQHRKEENVNIILSRLKKS